MTSSLVVPNVLPVTQALFNKLLSKYGSGQIFSGQADPSGVAWLEANVGLFTVSSLPGDFDADGLLTTKDIDLLSADVLQGTNDAQFDLSSDQVVDEDDRQVWFALANTLPGDANLDGGVMFDDFATLSNNFGQPGGWNEGDFSGNARVDFADFTLLSNNFGQAAAAVPEPKGLPIVTLLPMLYWCFRKLGIEKSISFSLR